MCALFVAMTILILIIIVIIVPVTVRLHIEFNKNKHTFTGQIGVFNDLLRKQFSVLPKSKFFQNTKQKDLFSLLQQTMCRIGFWQVDVFVLLGVGDAAQTALCCGILDAAFNAIASALLPRGKKGRGLLVRSTPAFDDTTLKAQIHGIFRFRLAQIILAALAWRNALKA